MSGFTAAGISPTTVTNESTAGADDAAQLAPLGFELTVPDGDKGFQTWVYVKVSSNVAEGEICMLIDEATQYEVALTPAGTMIPTQRIVGVAQHAILDNGFGFILKKGHGKIKSGASAAITKNNLVTTAGTTSAGRGLNWDTTTASADASIVGYCAVDASGINALATCFVDCG